MSAPVAKESSGPMEEALAAQGRLQTARLQEVELVEQVSYTRCLVGTGKSYRHLTYAQKLSVPMPRPALNQRQAPRNRTRE